MANQFSGSDMHEASRWLPASAGLKNASAIEISENYHPPSGFSDGHGLYQHGTLYQQSLAQQRVRTPTSPQFSRPTQSSYQPVGALPGQPSALHNAGSGSGWASTNDQDCPDLHTQLGSLGLIMGAITNDVVVPESVHINTVRTYSDRLKVWHANLPESLTLSMAVHETYDSPSRNSILLIHCAYLGSIILLTRRLHVELLAGRTTPLPMGGSQYASGSGPAENNVAEEFSRMCTSAARQLATVVDMLRREHRLTRKCWLIIQSAYTASVMICLDVASHRGRPMLESVFSENMGLIVKCINVLQHCAPYDAVADRYIKILQPIHDALSRPEPTSAAKRARLYRDPFSVAGPDTAPIPTNEEMLEHILGLLKRPLGSERAAMDHDHFAVRNGPESFRLQQHEPASSSAGKSVKQPIQPAQSVARELNFEADPVMRKYPYRSKEEYEAFFRRAA